MSEYVQGENSVIDLMLTHEQNARERLYLVASENSMSQTARLPYLSDIFSRYYFPLDPKHWAFPGNKELASINARAIELLREATGAKFISVRPISGINAMTIVIAALANRGQTMATISPENGGHPATGVIARRLGVRTVFIPYDQKNYAVRTEELPTFVERENVSMVYLDMAQILFPYPLKEMRKAIRKEIPIYYDGSHTLGLTFGGKFQDPLKEGATLFGGSTHKTIPGPHKAFIATNNEELFAHIDLYARKFVSHDHPADTAALAIVLEDMRGKWNEYAKRTIANAQVMAKHLHTLGFTVSAKDHGFTQTHQLWIDIAEHMDPYTAVQLLAEANIITNTINAPEFQGRSALRIGVQEITHLGANESEVREIAEAFATLFIEKKPAEQVRIVVSNIRRRLSGHNADHDRVRRGLLGLGFNFN